MNQSVPMVNYPAEMANVLIKNFSVMENPTAKMNLTKTLALLILIQTVPQIATQPNVSSQIVSALLMELASLVPWSQTLSHR
jgi:hypothetical protein